MNCRRLMYSANINILMVFAVVSMWNPSSPVAAQGMPSPDNTALTAVTATGDGWVANPPTPSVVGINDGADARPNATAATLSYYRLVGTAFNVRTSTTTFAYNFNGCVYLNGGTDNRLMAPLLIPDGSVIKFLRIYYDDTSAGSDLTAWITRYQPGVTSEDLTSVNSSGSAGFGTALSPEITHTVDLVSWAYTIVIAPNGNSAANSICGIRVAYYGPSIFGLALPLIQKN